ncbi:MAG: NAD(P) transhydrogenase subunit alpha [Clostridiales bacterium]|nr:NAD(P) transhydrogenase subunit alpha [Clostridiales bacterium]
MEEYKPLILIGIFIVSAIVGYFIINNVPTLLHTPLMSGMNALSGITIIGAIAVLAAEMHNGGFKWISIVIGAAAVFLAVINVAAGFGITGRMLRMFKKNKKEDDE